MGYHRAGWEVVGIDINPQPHYPFMFHQVDAVEYLRRYRSWFDAFHASPPCQRHSTLRTGLTREYVDILEPIRELLEETGRPYVIENVPGAPLLNPVRLCGTSLGCIDEDTELRRHRLFETNWEIADVPPCNHRLRPLGVYGDMRDHDRINGKAGRGWKAGRARARRLMGIDWEVTDRELAEAIPPSYTEFIGRQLADVIGSRP